LSESLNNFLDTLDFKFKEDEEIAANTEHVQTHNNGKNDGNEQEKASTSYSDFDGDNKQYIYNPTAQIVLDIDGHLPQFRRSSLTEEEEERMENEAVNRMNTAQKSTTRGGEDENEREEEEKQEVEETHMAEKDSKSNSNSFNNVIFKDSNVKNMNMNIINHHTHHDEDVEQLKVEIESLRQQVDWLTTSKLKLIMNANEEMEHLRAIIRNRLQ